MIPDKRNLARIFAADLILRWAYQMGKTPLLPLFAAALGAAEMMTGLIVAVSTFTGMILKPLFGMLSDRWGRRLWMLVAFVLFSLMPFLYQFVTTPEHLFALRLVHGLATAILGPVSLSYVADISGDNRATGLAVFGMARSIAGLGAPVSAGLLLTWFQIETVFTIIGLASLVAGLPLLWLEDAHPNRAKPHLKILQHLHQAFVSSLQNRAIWLAGGLELLVYLVTYAVKAFLPLFILSQDGGTVLQAGLFFTLQEGVHILFRPIGGRIADRRGDAVVILCGLGVLAVGIASLAFLGGLVLLLAAGVLGLSQALIFPASVALLAEGTPQGHRGAGMGFYGALRNIGKVAGPVLGGVLLTSFSFSSVFIGSAVIIGLAVFVSAVRTRHVL